MESIGISRPIDKIGRIVIPKDYRDYFQFQTNERIEIVAEKNGILLRKQRLHNNSTI